MKVEYLESMLKKTRKELNRATKENMILGRFIESQKQDYVTLKRDRDTLWDLVHDNLLNYAWNEALESTAEDKTCSINLVKKIHQALGLEFTEEIGVELKSLGIMEEADA